MDVSIQQIHELIRQGEGISTEFKTCRNKINRDVYETVCAFSTGMAGRFCLVFRMMELFRGLSRML